MSADHLFLVLPHPGGEPGQWLLRAGELSLQTRLAPTDKGLWVSGYCRSFITWFSVREFHFSLLYSKYPMSPSLPVTTFPISSKSHFPCWIKWRGLWIESEGKILIRFLPNIEEMMSTGFVFCTQMVIENNIQIYLRTLIENSNKSLKTFFPPCLISVSLIWKQMEQHKTNI